MNIYKDIDLTRIAWWSAELDDLTGQSIVTERVTGLILQFGGNGVFYSRRGIKSIFLWFFSIFKLLKLVFINKANQLYIVCSRSVLGFLRDLPAYLLFFCGLKLIIHTHGSDIKNLCIHPVFGIFARFFLKRSILVVPSEHLIVQMRDLGVYNVVCCENFYNFANQNTEMFMPNIDRSARKLSIYWNSNIIATKGFFVLAKAVEFLVNSGVDIRLNVIGKCIGDKLMDEKTCLKEFNKLLSFPWIYYYGKVSNCISKKMLLNSDIICLPSFYISECQPLAIIEAMCTGRDIIIANTPALVSTVKNYPCVKVEIPLTPESLAKGIMLCKSNLSQLKLTEESRIARERFSVDRFDNDIKKILGLK